MAASANRAEPSVKTSSFSRAWSKRFPGTVAVNDVGFAIKPGAIHALVGENGAGKSTLIKMLSGVLQPDEGRILVDGAPVALRTPQIAQAHGIVTIHQERTLVDSLSALENIFLGPRISAFGPRPIRPRGSGADAGTGVATLCRFRIPHASARSRGARPAGRRQADRRIDQGVGVSSQPRHHGRTDRGGHRP